MALYLKGGQCKVKVEQLSEGQRAICITSHLVECPKGHFGWKYKLTNRCIVCRGT